MADNGKIVPDLLEALARLGDGQTKDRCCVGFDGFIDNIYRVVKQRTSARDYAGFDTIAEFGERIIASSGRSSDTEIVLTETRAGGNAPNMAQSLANLGFPTSCVGLMGEAAPVPPFDALEPSVACITVGSPAFTQAFEFNDGKLMFGCMNGAGSLSWDDIKARAGLGRLTEIIGCSRLIAIVNWSYLYNITGIVRGVVDDILAGLPSVALHEKTLFFDFADISTRSRADIGEMLDALAYASRRVRTVLGLNENEALALCRALGLRQDGALAEIACCLREPTGAETLMIHSIQGSAGSSPLETVEAPSFFVKTPLISTGGGDNYNGGFCTGLLLGLPLQHCLALGSAAASYYISRGRSGSRADLIEFLRSQKTEKETAQ